MMDLVCKLPPIGVKNMTDQQWIALKERQQLPHAFLVSGLFGLGKKQLVEHYAHLLLCRHSTQQGVCHRCSDCQLLSAKSHPDYVSVELTDNSTLIKVDQIRELQMFLRQTPQQGHYRIVCIDPADKLHPSAANSLLKMLEEPGDKTVIFLISNNVSRLLATIKSRCFLISCSPPKLSKARHWLQTTLKEQSVVCSEQQCDDYLMQTGIAPLAALSLALSDNPLDWQDWLSDLAAIVLQQCSPVSIAEKWQNELLDALLVSWLHACCLFIHYCQRDAHVNERYVAPWRSLAELIATTPLLMRLFHFYDHLILIRRQLQGVSNPNTRLLLESLLIAWYNLNADTTPKVLI